MEEEIIKKLMDAGLTRAQAESKTANACIEAFMNDEWKVLIEESRARLNAMEKSIRDLATYATNRATQLANEYSNLKQRIEDASKILVAIDEAKERHGSVSEDKAKNALALYGAILEIKQKSRC